MATTKDAKTLALILSAISTLWWITTLVMHLDPAQVGMSADASPLCRLSYWLAHAGLLHLASNCWCLLATCFTYRVSTVTFIVAIFSAICAPSFLFLHPVPTIGLSGVVYFLLGAVFTQTVRRLYYLSFISLFIASGFLLPAVNAWLHAFSFIAGLMYALIFTPLKS